jgi:hypothetical protein
VLAGSLLDDHALAAGPNTHPTMASFVRIQQLPLSLIATSTYQVAGMPISFSTKAM